MAAAISITDLTKTYANGQHALKGVSLEIRPGEIFALLGPNGAGKTTLISIVCGIVRPTSGTVLVDGHDIRKDFRAARERIGLVPQELAIEAFETVRAAAAFSRDLSLWDRRDDILMTLSGGMKRRVMIAKALAHEPRILFLDEPTAGVDVELRRDLWELVRRLRDQGVTIILTTHYIDEAEELADRIGVVNHGELVVVDEKQALMKKLGKRQLTLTLQEPLAVLPVELAGWRLALLADGHELQLTFDAALEQSGVAPLLRRLEQLGIGWRDLNTRESSLEEIFVSLVGRGARA
jgi:ABC-2 type transport system ATP-binding protein